MSTIRPPTAEYAAVLRKGKLAAVRERFPNAEWNGACIFSDSKSTGAMWLNPTQYAYVSVLADGRFHYYFELPNSDPVENVVQSAADLPDDLGKAMLIHAE
jgi:hypothetical protein